jgi:hypothetical protein
VTISRLARSLTPSADAAKSWSVGDRPDNGAKTAAAGSDYGVFVKGRQKFITTDDLQVAPASTSLLLSLCKKFGVQDPTDLDKTILQLTSDKVLSITTQRTLDYFLVQIIKL